MNYLISTKFKVFNYVKKLIVISLYLWVLSCSVANGTATTDTNDINQSKILNHNISIDSKKCNDFFARMNHYEAKSYCEKVAIQGNVSSILVLAMYL